MNRGDSFKEISNDLTTGGRKGDVAFSTLTTIHESPLKFGLIYVGTDDGLVHITTEDELTLGDFCQVEITDADEYDLYASPSR